MLALCSMLSGTYYAHNYASIIGGSLLTSLDEHKASGPDRISPYILKHCADEITPILHIIFTQSISTSLLSNDWLKANICPVHKKGSRSNVANYRSISLTSICAKVMEHIIYHSIMSHLNQNNIISMDSEQTIHV